MNDRNTLPTVGEKGEIVLEGAYLPKEDAIKAYKREATSWLVSNKERETYFWRVEKS